MCKVQMLRALVEQRLTAAAEEIFGLFERTIAEYEEELCRSKEENERQRELLDAVFNPQLRLHRADVEQLSAVIPETDDGADWKETREPQSALNSLKQHDSRYPCYPSSGNPAVSWQKWLQNPGWGSSEYIPRSSPRLPLPT
ncbi:uncharacterized protein LOC120559390 isoform X3 [Perca fluviatilis]|uniref:uncharacterized protein LOC120559390 isoform X3 n=1 Tax=Perca fluviatilis TaxID=8168 RepID=UPI001965C0BA|nr:uncharacterized protein LOC120559390 isoform X3 [Perca fluviatilis]